MGGITESIGAATLADVGTAAATDAAIGAGIGGLTSAVTGGNILQGAVGGGLGGAVTGGLGAEIGGFGGGIVGDVAGGALSGALGGVVDSAVTGGNIGTGALLGGAMGGVMGGVNSTPTTGTGGGTSAISAGGSAPVEGVADDLTQGGAGGDYTSNGAGNLGQGLSSSSQLTQGLGAGSQLSQANGLTGGTDPFSNLQSAGNGLNLGGTSLTGAPSNATGGLFQGANQLPSGTLNANAAGTDVAASTSGGAGATGSAGGTNSGAGNLSSGKQILNALGQGDVGGAASGIGSALVNNPSTVLGALGLGASALTSQQQPKGYNQLSGEAGQLASQGAQLQQSLNGALPSGAQSALNQASNSAKTQIRSTYAASGLTGSTMEAQALANVDQTVAAQGFQMADQLYQQGVQESGMASNLYQQIMQVNAQSDAALSSSIGNFASALAGGGGSGLTQAERKALLGG